MDTQGFIKLDSSCQISNSKVEKWLQNMAFQENILLDKNSAPEENPCVSLQNSCENGQEFPITVGK